MTPKQRVQMILDSIDSVRRQATEARETDPSRLFSLMEDLNALHVCLVGEVHALLVELNKMRPHIIRGGKHD